MTKIALITGANKGIGLETARQLPQSGNVHVLPAARDRAKTSVALALLDARGPNGAFIHLGEPLPW